MKDLEEASKKHEQQFGFNSEGEINSSPSESFKAGVEFAQQWHRVEEELPTKSMEVLAKYKENGKEKIIVAKYIDIMEAFYFYYYDSYYEDTSTEIDVSFWRPIELN